jgi:hypothetical protein
MRNLDGPNRFEMAGEIRFCARRVFAAFALAGRAVMDRTLANCPTDKSVDGASKADVGSARKT